MKHDINQIRRAYAGGMLFSDIVKTYKVSKGWLSDIVKDLPKRIAKFDKSITQDVQNRYNNGEKLKNLAKEYNCKLSTLKYHIKTERKKADPGNDKKSPAHRKKMVVYVNRRRKKIKEMAVQRKGGCCVICKYDKCNSALEFHHLDPAIKSFNISLKGYVKSWEVVKAEVDKCILVCRNCHAEIHAGLVDVSGIIVQSAVVDVEDSGYKQVPRPEYNAQF